MEKALQLAGGQYFAGDKVSSAPRHLYPVYRHDVQRWINAMKPEQNKTMRRCAHQRTLRRKLAQVTGHSRASDIET